MRNVFNALILFFPIDLELLLHFECNYLLKHFNYFYRYSLDSYEHKGKLLIFISLHLRCSQHLIFFLC